MRTITDARLDGEPARRATGLGIRAIYYGILLLFSVWGVVAIRSASPFQLFKVLANIAGLVLVIAGDPDLPRQPPLPAARGAAPALAREAGLALCVAFYAFFSWFGLRAIFASLIE